MPWACRTGNASILVDGTVVEPIVTRPVGRRRGGGADGAGRSGAASSAAPGEQGATPHQFSPAACRANASGLVAVRSIAGSTVDVRLHVVLNFAPLPLNGAKTSTPSAGQRPHVRQQSAVERTVRSLDRGPGQHRRRAVERPGDVRTWCCMQCGKVVPSPTISDMPQAFAPRMLASHRSLWLRVGRSCR